MDIRHKAFSEALESFSCLTEVDMAALATQLDKRLIDGLDNGKAQKFEYTLELCWKAIKVALKDQEGIDEASPKKVVKVWYLAGHLAEDDYLAMIAAIDDRNKLSHIYNQQQIYASWLCSMLNRTVVSMAYMNLSKSKAWGTL